ncbi:MAG: hypothetical protein FD153_337 [Rhodospirillaceae bacterium]|nr:MAG: hypothetical protein FD153_337 [Rhodospirillaceae bacterium]
MNQKRAVEGPPLRLPGLGHGTSRPRNGGVLQARIGGLLYRLAMHTDKMELLKESLTAFQGALQVIVRAEEPFRWANIMHNLSQSL